ncbi:MAG: DUF3990 domain-containing protein [Bacteroidaceae bacterium]|nr:DUF3990 domain-containing protein [Bacteroidaceae bacterium]
MKLYHGSNTEIEFIDLTKGRKGKDFGRGFYLSEDYKQAVKMSEIVVRKEGDGVPCVTCFELDEVAIEQLNIKQFEGYTREWAEFVLANRRNRTDEQIHSYDIVIGPIADDAVGVQVRQLSRGYISFDNFLENIRYIVPTIQYFFGTEKSIQYLKKL